MQLFPAVYVLVSTLALLVATYTDLKSRIVPNTLVYGLAIIGILLKVTESYFVGTFEPLVLSAQGVAIAFIASYALYKLGVWAGGDVKLVSCLAILNPINYSLIATELALQYPLTAITLPIFAITLIIYSTFAVLPIGFVMTITAALKSKEILSNTISQVVKKWKQLLGTCLALAGAQIVLQYFRVSEFAIFPLLIAIVFLPKELRTGATISLAVAGAIIGLQSFIYNSLTIALPLMVGYGLFLLYSNSKEGAFKETIETQKLEEGMVVDSYIVEDDGKIEYVKGPSIKTVIKQLMDNKMEKGLLEDFKIKGKVISGPNQAGGISEEDAKKIKEAAKKGLAPKTIVIKKTMAFVPAILFAYIALQLSGDILWNV